MKVKINHLLLSLAEKTKALWSKVSAGVRTCINEVRVFKDKGTTLLLLHYRSAVAFTRTIPNLVRQQWARLIVFVKFIVRSIFQFFRYCYSKIWLLGMRLISSCLGFCMKRKTRIGATIFVVLNAIGWVLFLKLLPAEKFNNWVDGGAYFIGSGAAVIGLLAIASSLQALALQNAAENRSAGLYELEGRDWKSTLIFFVLSLIGLTFFVLSVCINGLDPKYIKIIWIASLSALSLVSTLLYVLYRHTVDKLSPLKVIDRALEKIQRLVSIFTKVSKKHAVVIAYESQQRMTREQAEAMSYSGVASSVDAITVIIDFLFDYHDKLLEKQEKNAARQVLKAVESALLKYIEMRKFTSRQQVVGLFGVSESDSQRFFSVNFQQLATRGIQYVRSGDDRGTTQVISVFKRLAIAASAIQYPEHADRDANPIFSQCKAYLDQVAEEARQRNYLEGMFQSVNAYAEIGAAALQHGPDFEFSATIQDIFKLSQQATRSLGQEVLWSAGVSSLNTFMQQLLTTNNPNQIYFKEVFEAWCALIVRGHQNGMSSGALLVTLPALQLLHIEQWIQRMIQAIDLETDPDRKSRLQTRWLKLIENFTEGVHKLGRSLRSTGHAVTKEIARLLTSIGCKLVDFSADAAWLSQQRNIRALLAQITTMSAHIIGNAEKPDKGLSFRALIDAQIQIAIRAYRTGDMEVAKWIMQSLGALANAAAAGSDFNNPVAASLYLMRCAFYLGILAMKDGNEELVRIAKLQAETFVPTLAMNQEGALMAANLEEAKEKAEDKIFQAVARMRDKKVEVRQPYEIHIYEETGMRQFLDMIEIVDIDRFTRDLWGKYWLPSDFEEEDRQASDSIPTPEESSE